MPAKPVSALRHRLVVLSTVGVFSTLVAITGAPPVGATGTPISSLAGTGTAGYAGDGGPAAAAQFRVPDGMAADASGNLYIADSGNHVIRKINTSGIISTVAGTGTAGFSGDGGQATTATFNGPAGVALDAAGNIFINDTANFRVRKVDTSGVVSTVVGNGIAGWSGDGGAATAAQISTSYRTLPVGNTLYVSDFASNVTRFVDSSGIITTFAGQGNAGFIGDGGPATAARVGFPIGLARDAGGNIYIVQGPGSSNASNRIRKVDPAGIISTYAGELSADFAGDGGPATSAHFLAPSDIVFDAAGQGIISDAGNHRIRRVNSSGIIYTIAGFGTAGYSGDDDDACFAQLNNPRGLVLTATGNLLIAQAGSNAVRKVVAPMPNCPLDTQRVRGLITDFDRDFKANISVFRSGSNTWHDHPTSGDPDTAFGWGASGDIAVPGDYDGDYKPDHAVYSPGSGQWAISNSSGADTFTTFGGVPGDVPVPGDYTGDGRVDLALFRPAFGFWYIHPSGGGADQAYMVGDGTAGDIPVPADYTGDGRVDKAIYRPSAGTWFVSPTGTTVGDYSVAYGTAGDIPLPADYDGDAKADIAIFRPSSGLWAIDYSGPAPDTLVTYGVGSDVPVPADYDGDRKADISIFRSSQAAWWSHQTTTNTDVVATFGLSSDKVLALPPSVRLVGWR